MIIKVEKEIYLEDKKDLILKEGTHLLVLAVYADLKAASVNYLVPGSGIASDPICITDNDNLSIATSDFASVHSFHYDPKKSK